MIKELFLEGRKDLKEIQPGLKVKTELQKYQTEKKNEKNAFRVLLQAATCNVITVEYPLADVHLASKSCQCHLSKLSFAR